MMQKLVILSGLVLSASSMVLHQPQIPVTLGLQYHDTPNYNFAYEVNDAHTGDIKSQHENRLGDSVLGQYSLLQPDGIRRTVDYRADEHAGFRATVNNEGRPVNQHQVQVNQYQNQVNEYQNQVNQYHNQVNQYQAQVNQHQIQTQQQQQQQVNAEAARQQPASLGQANLAAYWPAPTPASTPAPAVAVSRSSIVQTFSHGNGNHNPWL